MIPSGQKNHDIGSLNRSTLSTKTMPLTVSNGTKRTISTAAFTRAKRQPTGAFQNLEPSSDVYQFGNNWGRFFNFSRTAPPAAMNLRQQSFSTSASVSNRNALTDKLNSLQSWRRPYHYPSTTIHEARSLATMPSKPTFQAIPNSISDPAIRLQRSLTAFPQHSIKNEIKLRCTEFDHNGNVKTTAGEFLKSDLCQKVSFS
ncbi:hypothetical protein FBU30_005454 [Linnemannia zychae]|nr:hypothetical protein FBU30_005454 [Linnemannia zychae]